MKASITQQKGNIKVIPFNENISFEISYKLLSFLFANKEKTFISNRHKAGMDSFSGALCRFLRFC